MEEQVKKVFEDYEGKSIELIPILQQVQSELSYLPDEAMKMVAKFTGVPESKVFAVATFYEQFRFTPMGKNKITICRGTACHVRGAQRITEEIERHLGIETGETTEDLEYTIETAACIGCCGLAPVFLINEDTYGKQTPAKTVKAIKEREEAS